MGSIIDDVYHIFYTYSIKSSITRRMTGRLAIATLCLNVSSTAFWGYRTKRVGFIGDGASKLLVPSPF